MSLLLAGLYHSFKRDLYLPALFFWLIRSCFTDNAQAGLFHWREEKKAPAGCRGKFYLGGETKISVRFFKIQEMSVAIVDNDVFLDSW